VTRRSLTAGSAAPLTAGLAALLLAVTGLAGLAPTPASAVADRDCGDFATQRAAQSFFLDHGGPDSDPHRLDADGDGVACETNPCPCSTSQGGMPGSGAGPAPQPQPQPAQVKQRGRIVEVVDGDTVDVRLARGGVTARVRLIGIDTPEVHGGTECGGPAASRSARKILPRGARVLLVSDPSQDLEDRYGRLLRYVMKGKVDVNRLQVKRGHARVYVYAGTPFRRVAGYRGSQAAARQAGLGLWGACR